MKRPRYLGHFDGCPVFRIDSPEAQARVFNPARWRPMFDGTFRPGLQLVAGGIAIHVGPGTLDAMGDELDAVCSTPRLARTLRALDARGAA